MRKINFGYQITLLLFFFCFSLLAEIPQQIISFNLDADDNALFLPTQIWIVNKETGKEKGVSTTDFAEVRTKLGKPGEWEKWDVGPMSMRDFSGSESLLRDMKKILADKSEKWRGPSFEALMHALSNAETAGHTTIITARQHPPKAFIEALKLLQTYMSQTHQKKIYLPPEENIFPVGWQELPAKYKEGIKGDPTKNPSAIKANIMLELLSRIDATPLPENAFETISQDGNGKAKLHLWGFSDDDYGNFSKAVEMLSRAVKAGKFKNTKIVIFYTGTKMPGVNPHSIVIKSDGTNRPTVKGEARFTDSQNTQRLEAEQLQLLLEYCRK